MSNVGKLTEAEGRVRTTAVSPQTRDFHVGVPFEQRISDCDFSCEVKSNAVAIEHVWNAVVSAVSA